jgi:hypothetical protein
MNEKNAAAWLEICDPMQVLLQRNIGWDEMDRIYYNP